MEFLVRHRGELLDVAGLTLLSASAWSYALAAGLAAAGVSCCLLAWRLGRDG
ncbi:hypothetical protein [Streptomyces sp. NBC_01373]|uniref:hypothetical protein n=1 Tax=Streptomyces sp. NBC_01373 TaxID=2903843 RepID=UPI002259889B|nr:hypothetical protein [Streptomyces sp. NBC_01373]MCX4699530.1 hypothetical protein [Streptomyces sp. NBC_01373]